MNTLSGNSLQDLQTEINRFKQLYNNLNIFEINLREYNEKLSNLIIDLSWTEFLSSPNDIFTNLQYIINQINNWLEQWETAEKKRAGKNFILLKQIELRIVLCHKILIKIFLYYENCTPCNLHQICDNIYTSYNTYKLTQYLFRIKQSFIVQEEQLDYEIDLTSLISIFRKHFTLFLSTKKISPLLFYEIKSNLAFEHKIGSNRLEELFFMVLGSTKNFKIFLDKNFWYCKIENALKDNLISLENIVGSKQNSKIFEIELKGNYLNGYRSEKLVLDDSAKIGSDRFRQCRIATIGKNDEGFENDIKLVNLNEIDTVCALLYLQNSKLYLIDLGTLSSIKLCAKQGKRIKLKSAIKIFIGRKTEVEVSIPTERTIILKITYNNEDKLITDPITIETSTKISIGTNTNCTFQVPDPKIGEKSLEIYSRSKDMYFKAFNDCTFYSLKFLNQIESKEYSRSILLEHNQEFSINSFWFEVYIS